MNRDAARLLWRAALLLSLNALAGLVALTWLGRGHALNPWETDAKLEGFRFDQPHDLIILGTSRAYTLSRYEANHKALEEGLRARVLNLAMPAAGGVKPAWTYLRHALDRGMRPKAVLIALDPFVFFSEACNEQHKFVYYEPFEFGFFRALLADAYPWRRILTHVRHKFTLEWILREPSPLPRFDNALSSLPDQEHVARRMDSLYLEGLSPEKMAHYGRYLRKMLERCQSEGIAAHVMLMPTLLGEEPGAAAFHELLNNLREEFAFTQSNLVDAMPSPEYFYDSDHMNAAGVERFVSGHLAPWWQALQPVVAFDLAKYAKLHPMGTMR
ncbi:MAG: hypothetical protein RLZZ303_294, partial [Candidatus Hydrogenedentota bacterium]